MSSPFRRAEVSAVAVVAAAVIAATTLARADDPNFPTREPGVLSVPTTTLFPGGGKAPPPNPIDKVYQNKPQAIAEGARLFEWYNCSGCHFHGGGGMGPALMDKTWRYGGSLDQIHASIVQGRPNGMPSWQGKIPDDQIWEIAAFVRSLSEPTTVNGGTAESMPKSPAPPMPAPSAEQSQAAPTAR